MKNLYKKIFGGLLVALSVVSLGGCKKKQLDPFDLSQGGYDDSIKTEIVFYHTMGSDLQDVLDYYIKEFNTIYPNITVKHTAIGGYGDVRDQLSKELTVGSECTLSYCYPDHVALYNLAKSVVPLDDLINDTTFGLGLTNEQVNDFIDAYYNEGKQFGDGKMYCLPFSKSTEVMYYDKTFFDEHNLKVPTNWDEMETVCRQIKALDPYSIPLGYDSDSNWFITMCEQYQSGYTTNTTPHFHFDNNTTKSFLERFKVWYQEGLVHTKTTYGAYTSSLFTTLEKQRCYICIGSSAGASYQAPELVNGQERFRVGIASIPQLNQNHKAVISQGPSVCIFNNADRQKVIASWIFLKYLLTSIPFQAAFSMQSGYVPVLKSVYQNPTYKAWLENTEGNNHIQALSVKVCGEQSDAYFSSPAFVGSAEARDQVGTVFSNVITNNKSYETAMREALEECEYAASAIK